MLENTWMSNQIHSKKILSFLLTPNLIFQYFFCSMTITSKAGKTTIATHKKYSHFPLSISDYCYLNDQLFHRQPITFVLQERSYLKQRKTKKFDQRTYIFFQGYTVHGSTSYSPLLNIHFQCSMQQKKKNHHNAIIYSRVFIKFELNHSQKRMANSIYLPPTENKPC